LASPPPTGSRRHRTTPSARCSPTRPARCCQKRRACR
jgi:hypothetical protein